MATEFLFSLIDRGASFWDLWSKRLNSDEFKSGGAACEANSSNLELGNHHICLKTEEKQENSCRDGRSRDHPDAHRLLASRPTTGERRDPPWLHQHVYCWSIGTRNITHTLQQHTRHRLLMKRTREEKILQTVSFFRIYELENTSKEVVVA